MDARGHAVLDAVTGDFTGSTDEILQWGTYKWGFDPDLVRASALDESSWHQNTISDIGSDIGNRVSLGILQIKSRYRLGTCPQSPRFSTAFAVDYRLAYRRACMNKSITHFFNHEPTSGHSRYADAGEDELIWGCGSWYSGHFFDVDSVDHIQKNTPLLRQQALAAGRLLCAVTARLILSKAPEQSVEIGGVGFNPQSRAIMRSPRSRRIAAMLTSIIGLTLADRSSAEYLLAPGDVLEITALGIPDLKQSTTIDVDGQVYFPVLGQMKAAGVSLPELRDKVRELLPSKVFRRRTQEGRDYPVIVTADEVNIDVAQYRPVYLDGDVAKPGSQAYRPGLTVRQAITLAGGYDVMRFRGRDPFLEAADFRAEYYALWTDFAKEEAHISRLKSQLAGKSDLDRQGRIETPISPSVATDISNLATRQLKAELADHQDEKVHLRDAIDQEDRRASILAETEAKEKEGAQAEARDLDEMRQYFAKGVVPVMRLSEVRRLSLISSTQALQTTALLATVQREQGELKRRLRWTDGRWQIDLTRELQDAQVHLETIRVRIQAVGEKLEYAGLVRSQLVRGRGGSPSVRIFRDQNQTRQTLSANEDTELLPGDVVEVALRMDGLAGGPGVAP
jgi:polysaccharide export outer membrane protein